MAEAVMQHLLVENGLSDKYFVDSAGTGGWHAGESADHRTLYVLREHGIENPSLARQFTSKDFGKFEWIFAMDNGHLASLKRMQGYDPKKVHLFLSWDENAPAKEVPDPYYGGASDFDYVYSLVDSGCRAILEKIRS